MIDFSTLYVYVYVRLSVPHLALGYCQMYHKVCDPLSQPFHNILILSNQFQSPATAVLLKSDIIFPTSVAFPQSVKKFRDYI